MHPPYLAKSRVTGRIYNSKTTGVIGSTFRLQTAKLGVYIFYMRVTTISTESAPVCFAGRIYNSKITGSKVSQPKLSKLFETFLFFYFIF